MPKKPIMQKVMRYFETHIGQHIYTDDLASYLDESRPRILKSVGYIISRDKLPGLRSVTNGRGGPWIYRPSEPDVYEVIEKPNNSKPIYQYVGSTKDGSFVVEAEDGKLFRVSEL
jgi:hypothetical protein